MAVLFMDFESKDPAVVRRSHQLLHTMEAVAPVYEHVFKVYWTSDPNQLRQRRLLGITWEELPSIGFNTLDHQAFAYPRHYGFEREAVEKWIKDLSRGKAGAPAQQTYSAQESD